MPWTDGIVKDESIVARSINHDDILHENIDQTLVNSLHSLLNCEIKRGVYNTCPLYTHITPILQCIGPCNLFRKRHVNVLMQLSTVIENQPSSVLHFGHTPLFPMWRCDLHGSASTHKPITKQAYTCYKHWHITYIVTYNI